MEIKFNGQKLNGSINLDHLRMTSLPATKPDGVVDLCFKKLNQPIDFQINGLSCDDLDYENKKKLGAEISKRWNNSNPDYSKLDTEIIRQSNLHKVEDFDSPHNWLVRCIGDANRKLGLK